MDLKVLGVAGGGGVIIHPFKPILAGNIETRSIFNTPGDIQWKLNFDQPLYKSYRNDLGDINVIVGAPDCGHSSILAYSRKKALSDPNQNHSLNIYLKAIHDYQPKFFLLENLPKLIESWDKDINLIFADYRLVIHKTSVSSWGNSQLSRVRLVIMGIRRDLSPEYDLYLEHLPFIPQSKLKKSAELIQGLEKEIKSICHVREPMDKSICLYYKDARNITAKEAQFLWMGKYKNECRWPVPGSKMKNQPGVYRNFAQNYPLTVRKQNRQFNHHGLMLSPREIARIQGIPDNFNLWYNEEKGLYCINKARVTTAKCPPYEIGQWFYNKLINL